MTGAGVVPGMDWTQHLKELADAVEVRNRRVVRLRTAGSHVAELTAQALAAGAPGPALRRILASMEPLVEHERPHVCGQSPVVPPGRPAPMSQQAAASPWSARRHLPTMSWTMRWRPATP
jgi:hypothetical protein